MKVGDLVQVLPAKIGYYIITGRTKIADDYVGPALGTVYWNLAPLCGANFDRGGPMSKKFIEVVSESR